jgi:hypothetical protein
MYINIKVRFGVLIFSGGLMKKSLKSLTLGVPAVLLLALLFLGCPQDSDDDDDDGGSWSGESYQKDVDGIAVAFADGAPVVYLKDNLHLKDNELVIPEGKTLDLSRGVTIDQIENRGKLVVVGTIKFADGNNDKFNINLYESPGARLIATREFIAANVETLLDETAVSKEPTLHIKALANQLIEITDFDIRNPDAWQSYINGQADKNNSSYIPVKYSGTTIDSTIANNISKYGSGRRVYLIGNVETESRIDIKGDKEPDTVPPEPAPPEDNGNIYNVIDDGDGSLLIAGSIKVKDGGTIKTAKGFTVLGTLATDNANLTINEGGQLIAYLLRLDNTGATFKGPVKLIGTLPSNLGEGSFFYDDLEVNGSIILTSVDFVGTAESKWVFYGPVEFAGNDKSISVTSGAQLTLKGPVSVTNKESPVNIADLSKFKLEGDATITYGIPYTNTTSASEPANLGGSVSFDVPVTFNKRAEFAGSAVTVRFNKGVTFNKEAAFHPDATIYLGTHGVSTFFSKDISLKTLEAGSIAADVTFGESATFTGATPVDFQGNVKVSNKLILNAGGTFVSARFDGDVTVPAGSQLVVAYKKDAYLDYKGLLKIKAGTTDTASYTSYISADNVDLKLTGNGLVLGAGSLTLGTVGVELSGLGNISFDAGTSGKAGTYGLILKGKDADNVKTYIEAGNYRIAPASGNDWIINTGKGGKVILGTDKIWNGVGATGSLGVLGLGGTWGAQQVLLTVVKDITIDGVAVDLQGGGSIGVAALSSTNLPVITLEAGSATAYVSGGGSVTLNPAGVSAGAIVPGGTASEAVFGGFLLTASGIGGYTSPSNGGVPKGFIISKELKTFATAGHGGTYTAAAGSIGTLGQNGQNYIIGGSEGFSGVPGSLGYFADFYLPVESADAAKGLLTNKNMSVQDAGGSVAVFKYAPPPAPPAE